MTTQNDERDVALTECFDPFPEPRTIPAGWDVSEFFSASHADSAADSALEAESH